MQDKNLQEELAILEQEEKSYAERLREQKASVEGYILDVDTDEPALYVGTYRKYNEGSLFGAWISLSQCGDYDTFMEVCHDLHADEEDPELMFQDFMGFPEAWYSECGIDEDTFHKIFSYGELENKELFDAYLSATGDESIENCMERYMGDFNTEADFAEYIVNECYDLDRMMGRLSNYFNYAAFGRDLFYDGYILEDGHVWDMNR